MDPPEPPEDKCPGDSYVEPNNRDIQVQLVLSLLLGIPAFVAFCLIRPRWKTLYAARKRRFEPNTDLPTLPDTFFGWIPALYRVTEEQVLSAAGLDAYVFLSFFKMSVRLFAIMFFFAAVVLEPINQKFNPDSDPYRTPPHNSSLLSFLSREPSHNSVEPTSFIRATDTRNDRYYLWPYILFVYFFTFLTIWFVNSETFKVIKIRQSYLGTQSTITDRTFRISGIPKELRSEAKLKELVEKLEIGQVEGVTLCRDWKELDGLVAERQAILFKLEELWTVYLGQKPINSLERAPRAGRDGDAGTDRDEEAGEQTHLLGDSVGAHQFAERERPLARIWYGFLRLQSRKTDAIDYYEEKLHRLDEKIRAGRKKEHESADLAFVTMDSIAACQMAIQALLDPRPGELLTKLAPAPSDIIWSNTYMPRVNRRMRSWAITIFIAALSVVWLVPVASVASLLSLCTIKKWAPGLAASLGRHDNIKALMQSGLPTAVVSLLNVAVPYLYEYLSYSQGMLSRGDVELSIISKNFFFTFFNIFLVFTIFGTATSIWTVIEDSLRDTTSIARTLAEKVGGLAIFYSNFIMLQGLGLFPFRLLQFGSVSLYPIYRMGAKTPRDFKEITAPSVFSYGFYLPTALLVFILCLIYSVLVRGFIVLLLGVVYFGLGYFTYKYQLLYAMDTPTHATGGAWRIIAHRILLGLVMFHLTMSGYLGARGGYAQAVLVIPLLAFTIWYSYYFRRRFAPLTRFIALRSILRDGDGDREGQDGEGIDVTAEEDAGGPFRRGLLRRGSTVDEDREKGLRFVNPSLVVPLEQPWIYQEPPPVRPESEQDSEHGESSYSQGEHDGTSGVNNYEQQPATSHTSASTGSSFSLGDTHVWREGNGDHEG